MSVPELSDLKLKDVDTVAVDLETHDPDLKTLGSGAIVGRGKVVGVAIAYKDKRFYFPMRHSDKVSNIAPNHVWVIGDYREDSAFGHFLIKEIRGKIVLY